MKTAETPTLYIPSAALVVFRTEDRDTNLYIEYYDMDESGCPINPHPLTVKEAQGLVKALDTRKAAAKVFLKPKGLLPSGVLHLNPAENGSVVWYTKPMRKMLHFKDDLGLPSCELPLPALVWAADKQHLHIFALKGKGKPRLNTPLYHAPFFNLYRKGNVCMGSVDVHISASASLEEFTSSWENYFFGSYFSHLIDGHNPVGMNLLSLYKSLAGNNIPFPVAELLPAHRILNDLIP